MSYKYIEAEVLKGKTLTAIAREKNGELINLTTEDGKRYAFLHNQDCCESVSIHDITGELSSLLGQPLLVAVKSEESETWPEGVEKPEYCDSFTWTTLLLETASAKVRVRWLGESNGYYGEGIDLEELSEN